MLKLAILLLVLAFAGVADSTYFTAGVVTPYVLKVPRDGDPAKMEIAPGYAVISRSGVITPINLDSTARARFSEDSALAVSLLQSAAKSDSTTQVQRAQARTIWELAVRNLRRDTAKAE